MAAVVTLAIVAGAAVAYAQLPVFHDQQWKDRRDASAAIKALQRPDLVALDKQLAAHRGDVDFAYHFTSQTNPRTLGDALASAVGTGGSHRLVAELDSSAYDLDLTDLAGTLALATHGTGALALPASWTTDFAEATTTPATLYPAEAKVAGDASRQRADQDAANKQNLLLLLSRGYWSTDFLKTVTTAYWKYDHGRDDNGWRTAPLADAKYAPAPNGGYLTDGVLALTAALTANPEASAWAFADFRPGTQTVSYDGADHQLGNFAHYLFIEHHYPTASGSSDNLGMTATLTALSSAIDASGGVVSAVDTIPTGPTADSLVLLGLAKSYRSDSGCSWNPIDYWHCAEAVAKDLWHLVQHWGHSVLDVLSLATFAPPPFDAVGVGAAATNATWYAIDGDYAAAGLSLAAAVPGLAFAKVAKAGEAAANASKGAEDAATLDNAAAQSAKVADAAAPSRRAAQLDDALKGAFQVVKGSPRYLKEKDAETAFADSIPGATTKRIGLKAVCDTGCDATREFDVRVPHLKQGIEVKSGMVPSNYAHDLTEVQRDVALRGDAASGVDTVVWHFFPDKDGVVGPYEKLRLLLQANRIPYVMHVP